MRTIITKAQLVRSDGVFSADLAFEAGQITEIGANLSKVGAKVIVAEDCYLLPGGVDVHTHVNLKIGDIKVCDGFSLASQAAICGGTTTIVEHPGFGPQNCSLQHQLNAYLQEAAGKSYVDYALHGVLQHLNEQILLELATLPSQGFPSIKAYMTYAGRLTDAELLQVLEVLKQSQGLLTVHAENHEIIEFLKQKQYKLASDKPESFAKSRPDFSEAEAINRVLALAKAVDAPLYIVHLSTSSGLELVRKARLEGQKVYLETCPQYLCLTADNYKQVNGLEYIMAPPLRSYADQEALWQGLKTGDIQVVATDHCNFSAAQKYSLGKPDVFQCPGGIAGLETRLPLLFSQGVLTGRIDLPKFIEVVATNPAKIMGLNKGHLAVGQDADLVIFDPRISRVLNDSNLKQKSVYTGMTMQGWPRQVWLRGELMLAEQGFCGQPMGKFMARKAGV